jgi:hypothetical protein
VPAAGRKFNGIIKKREKSLKNKKVMSLGNLALRKEKVYY